MPVLVVIPARYASTRFPGKPLADIAGKSMIQRVYERCQNSSRVDRVIVATDDERIMTAVAAFGGEAELTSEQHQSGTDRCAEVAARHPEYDTVVNVQGDEPFIHPESIELAIQALQISEQYAISTLAHPINAHQQITNPNVVKMVWGPAGALYFSRHAIPFLRDLPLEEWAEQGKHHQHLGLYCFRRATLLELSKLPPAPLEQLEKLEQLRWLEAGHRISVAVTPHPSIGVDTPEDLATLVAEISSDEFL